jgi:hypothetical protein
MNTVPRLPRYEQWHLTRHIREGETMAAGDRSNMVRGPRFVMAGLAALALAGCGTSTSAPTASNTPTATPQPVATPTPAGGGGGQLTLGSIDPCTLMTTAEVAMVSGYVTGPGVNKVVGPARECLFGYVGQDVWVSVSLWQGVDPAAAKTYYDAYKAMIPPSFTITELPTFHGGAVFATTTEFGSGADSDIYVIDGSNVFNVGCVMMRPPCSDGALEEGANFVFGRLP